MASEFLIGRDSSQCQIVVPHEEKTVSNRHARICVDDKTVVIEDVGSTNGTFVNGIRVVKKVVTPTDVVTLGSPDGYRMDLSGVLKPADHDFSAKVRHLQQIHDEYHENKAQLSKEQGKALRIRMLPTMIVGSCGAIAGACIPEKYRIAMMIGVGVLTVIVFMITSHIASERMAASARRRKMVDEQYELDFVCPECGGSWRSHSFAYIARLGACPCCKKKFNL